MRWLVVILAVALCLAVALAPHAFVPRPLRSYSARYRAARAAYLEPTKRGSLTGRPRLSAASRGTACRSDANDYRSHFC
jgi:hypothetical protein